MIKRAILFFVLCLCHFVGAAAFTPAIEISAADIRRFASAPGKYSALMERMLSGDDDLTLTEYAYLYYGFSYTDGFRRGTGSQMEAAMWELAEKERYMEAWAMCTDYLAENPFSMFALNLGVFLTDQRGEQDVAESYSRRSRHILDVIRATGDGSARYPFQVLYQGDILYYLTFQVGVQEPGTPDEDTKGRQVYRVDVDGTVTDLWFAFDLCRK